MYNIKAKYSIFDENTYNFNKTGFIIGVITPTIVVTTLDSCSKVKQAQPGNRKWVTVI
jgi:hypothetical protein